MIKLIVRKTLSFYNLRLKKEIFLTFFNMKSRRFWGTCVVTRSNMDNYKYWQNPSTWSCYYANRFCWKSFLPVDWRGAKCWLEFKYGFFAPSCLFISKLMAYSKTRTSSQYRNKFIFGLNSNYLFEVNLTAVWNYMDADHGKSAHDGIGEMSKKK